MARAQKDWGNIPSPQDVAEQMNSIEKLYDDLVETEREYSEIGRELSRRRDLITTARNELGRMLKARSERDLRGTEFRVIHESEAHGNVMETVFGKIAVGGLARDG